MEHVPNPFKYLTIGAGAFSVTVLCFLLMQMLIQTNLQRAPEYDPPRIKAPMLPNALRDEPRDVRTRATRLLPADMPPTPDGIPIAPEEVVMTVKAPLPTFGSIADLVDQDAMDFEMFPPVSDLVPVYVVQPVYPFKAVMKQIEGFVIVNFSVRENGTVVNPIVISSEPGTLFDEAALSAVGKFRFQPRIVGGDAITAPDLRMKFLFRLESFADGSSTTIVDAEPVNQDAGGNRHD